MTAADHGTSRVHVIGEVMVDLIARVPHPPARGTDTPAVMDQRDGGSAANVAAWLASLGVPVSLIARVGLDPAGDAALRSLSDAGVSLHVSRDDQAPTGRCVVIVTPDGERTMLPDPGANALLEPSCIDDVDWASGDHLHVSGYTLLRPGARAAAESAISRALAAGLTVSVDASSADPIAEVGGEAFLGWSQGCHILFANEDEAAALIGGPDAWSNAAAIAERGFLAVVKRGALGAIAAAPGGGRWDAPAVPAQMVDSTGAGDAFAAGFLASWLGTARGSSGPGDMELALRHGASIAARAVACEGGRP